MTVQCILSFQHKFKCKIQTLQRTTWSKVRLCTLKAFIVPAGYLENECNCGGLSLEWKYRALKRGGKKIKSPVPFLSHTHTHTLLILSVHPLPPPHHSQQQRKEHDEPSGPRNLPELGVSMHSEMNMCRSETRTSSFVWAYGKKDNTKLNIFYTLISPRISQHFSVLCSL